MPKKLLGDLVLLREIKQDSVTSTSGVFRKSKSEPIALVIMCGPGKFEFGKYVSMETKKGDTVMFVPGNTVEIDGEPYYLVSEKNILAIM